MKNVTLGLILGLTVFITPTSTLLADDGKTLYNNNCTACHGTEVFTRADRRVKDMAGLKKRITQCSYAVEASWFEEEVNAVAGYLNKSFYSF